MHPSSEEKNSTLEQGLKKFYEHYWSHLSHKDEALPNEVKAFFRAHDIAHVVFGCDISLFGEGSVKVWTVFGTTLGFWHHIRAYRKANAFELSRKLSFKEGAIDLIKLLVAMPLLIIRAKKMCKPWPWTDFERYLEMPIAEIRKEFNIHVLE